MKHYEIVDKNDTIRTGALGLSSVELYFNLDKFSGNIFKDVYKLEYFLINDITKIFNPCIEVSEYIFVDKIGNKFCCADIIDEVYEGIDDMNSYIDEFIILVGSVFNSIKMNEKVIEYLDTHQMFAYFLWENGLLHLPYKNYKVIVRSEHDSDILTDLLNDCDRFEHNIIVRRVDE